ncbi:MAG: hypothetical protein WA210_05655 [Burkholderiaceae bacterium]
MRVAISKSLPGIVWSKPTHGTVDARESHLEFDLGNDDPVTAITISVRAAEDAKLLLFALATSNKWSLLDMGTGAYLAPDEPASSRISALMDKQDVPYEEFITIACAELERCVTRLEHELVASFDHCCSAGYKPAKTFPWDISDIRDRPFHEKIEALHSLISQFPQAMASKWRRLVDDTQWTRTMTEALIQAMSVSKGPHANFSFDLQGVKMALPPIGPVVQIAEAEELLVKFNKARSAIKIKRAL